MRFLSCLLFYLPFVCLVSKALGYVKLLDAGCVSSLFYLKFFSNVLMKFHTFFPFFYLSGGMGGLQNMMKQFQGASGQMGGPGGPGPSKGRKK